jgi:hypothetical protein
LDKEATTENDAHSAESSQYKDEVTQGCHISIGFKVALAHVIISILGVSRILTVPKNRFLFNSITFVGGNTDSIDTLSSGV